MNQNTGITVALLIVGLLLGLSAAYRIVSGKTYIVNPPSRVTRQQDPFSFWLSVGPLALVAAGLMAGALFRLVAG